MMFFMAFFALCAFIITRALVGICEALWDLVEHIETHKNIEIDKK